uniref:Mediator of RNA polymerase II transcription subunit 19 n=1 Tax=Chrysolophus pictus TaxID=9089 RepID=A0A8C3L1F3_CHRPC
MIDLPGSHDNSSLRSLIEKPPICGSSFTPLTGTMLTGFRLHAGPLPEQCRLMHIQPPKKKNKHKHKQSRTQDPVPPETPSDSDHKKKKKKKEEDPERKRKKKEKKKKKVGWELARCFVLPAPDLCQAGVGQLHAFGPSSAWHHRSFTRPHAYPSSAEPTQPRAPRGGQLTSQQQQQPAVRLHCAAQWNSQPQLPAVDSSLSQSTAGKRGQSWPPLAESMALQPPCLHCVADGDLMTRTLLELGFLPLASYT